MDYNTILKTIDGIADEQKDMAITIALAETYGNKPKAAKLINMPYRTFARWVENRIKENS